MSPISPGGSVVAVGAEHPHRVSRSGRPTLPSRVIHSSPRIAVMPRPSLMP